jgi:hypothetical protein
MTGKSSVEVVDHRDVSVIQLGKSKSFVAKFPEGGLVGKHTWKENLQRNFAVKVFVIGAVHDSRTTAAYLTFDSVVAENSADERIWGGSDGGHGKPSSSLSAGILGLNRGEVNEEPFRHGSW